MLESIQHKPAFPPQSLCHSLQSPSKSLSQKKAAENSTAPTLNYKLLTLNS